MREPVTLIKDIVAKSNIKFTTNALDKTKDKKKQS